MQAGNGSAMWGMGYMGGIGMLGWGGVGKVWGHRACRWCTGQGGNRRWGLGCREDLVGPILRAPWNGPCALGLKATEVLSECKKRCSSIRTRLVTERPSNGSCHTRRLRVRAYI